MSDDPDMGVFGPESVFEALVQEREAEFHKTIDSLRIRLAIATKALQNISSEPLELPFNCEWCNRIVSRSGLRPDWQQHDATCPTAIARITLEALSVGEI